MPLPTGSTWWLLPGRQGRLRPEEGLVETLALGQVGDAALLFLEARHAALQLRPATGTQARRASRLRITLAFTA